MTATATPGLTSKQHAAIRALLSGQNLQESAAAAGVSPNTITGWMRAPLFLSGLSQAEQAARESITRALVSEGLASIQVLVDVRDDPNAGAANRVRAAATILDRILRMSELVALEQRISKLEDTYAK